MLNQSTQAVEERNFNAKLFVSEMRPAIREAKEFFEIPFFKNRLKDIFPDWDEHRGNDLDLYSFDELVPVVAYHRMLKTQFDVLKDCKEQKSEYCAISVKIAKNLSFLFDMVNVWPISSIGQQIYWKNYVGDICTQSSNHYDFILKTNMTFDACQDLKSVNGIDAKTELMNILGEECSGEIIRSVIKDLIHVATPVVVPSKHIEKSLEFVMYKMQKMEIPPTFMLMGGDIHAELSNALVDFPTDDYTILSKIGQWRDINILKDSLLPDRYCLLGSKKGNMGSDYTFAPRTLFELLPTVLDPNLFMASKKAKTVYAKHFSKIGVNKFVLIKFK